MHACSWVHLVVPWAQAMAPRHTSALQVTLMQHTLHVCHRRICLPHGSIDIGTEHCERPQDRHQLVAMSMAVAMAMVMAQLVNALVMWHLHKAHSKAAIDVE